MNKFNYQKQEDNHDIEIYDFESAARTLAIHSDDIGNSGIKE